MSGAVVGLGVIVSLVVGCGGGCGGSTETDVDARAEVDDTVDVAVGPPVFGGYSIVLVPGQLAGLRVAVLEGVAESIEVVSVPEEIAASLDRSDPRDTVTGFLNLRVAVEPGASFGRKEIELLARGPGGEGRGTVFVEVAPHADPPAGFVVGVGAAEASLMPGDTLDVPLRVSSFGGWAGPVLLWVEHASPVEAFDYDILDPELEVTPEVPGDTVLRLVARQADAPGDVSLWIRGSSGRERPTEWTTTTGFLPVHFAATPEVPRLWPELPRDLVLVAPAGQSATQAFAVWRSGSEPPTFVAAAPDGWLASVELEGFGGHNAILTVTATASAPEGGADLPISATSPDGGRWSGNVRLVRPPTSGAWRYPSDAPLAADDEAGAEVVWDGANRVSLGSLVHDGFVLDGGGVTWGVQGGGAELVVLRAGFPYDTIPLGGRSARGVGLVAQARDEVVVGCACAIAGGGTGAIMLFRHVKAGLFEIEWEAIPPLIPGPGEMGVFALAATGDVVTVVYALDDALRAQVHDGAAWQDLGVVGSLVPFQARGSRPQAALTLDGDGRPVVAWIDAVDGAARVATWTGAAWGEARAPVAPSPGLSVIGVDLLQADGREVVLLHEAPDLMTWLHPRVGASPRLRVLEHEGDEWVEHPDVTLPDAWWAPVTTTLARGDDGATWVAFDGWVARRVP
ncbi:MAG: hypothetical protein IT385_26275 [Deltaproteobacteria bacterium]|nr:hypothetical protein [Deltaproteobacteria bacterium]